MRRLLLTALALLSASLAQATPDKWTADIKKFEAADKTNPPPAHSVVFVGSSSIVKWTSLKADFPGIPVINRGFGGSELADSVFYADRIVIPYRPRTVVLYAGDNDLKSGKSPEKVFADFKAFVAKVHAGLPQTRIVYIAIKPSPSRWNIHDKIMAANALIAAECQRDPLLAFADVYSAMLDAQGQPRPELFVADKLHMNPKGYALWTPVVGPLIR
jgi:lysophospholipase L1-like esterase